MTPNEIDAIGDQMARTIRGDGYPVTLFADLHDYGIDPNEYLAEVCETFDLDPGSDMETLNGILDAADRRLRDGQWTPAPDPPASHPARHRASESASTTIG